MFADWLYEQGWSGRNGLGLKPERAQSTLVVPKFDEASNTYIYSRNEAVLLK